MSREVHVRFCESLGVQFPGATHPHISGKNRLGRFTVRRKTIRKRMRAKLQEVKQQLRDRMHDPVRQTGQWLKSIVQGHFLYYAVPGNLDSLGVFRDRLVGHWWRTLRRRSQKHLISWKRTLACDGFLHRE
jgi:RNA-directed DNA polymerase